MKIGDRATFNCPPEYAYGDRGTRSIAPGSTLQFDVEVLDAKPAGWTPPQPKKKVGPTLPQYEHIDTSQFDVDVYHHGEGDEVRRGEKVLAHYTGTLLDGTVFDSSRVRGKPYGF